MNQQNPDEKPWEIGPVEMLDASEIGYPIYANKIETQTGNVYIIDMTSDESFIPKLSKLMNIKPMKTITDLEKAAIKAKFILDPKGGIITQRDGNFEVWGEWSGFKPDSIACEKTEQEAIESAIKYLEANYE